MKSVSTLGFAATIASIGCLSQIRPPVESRRSDCRVPRAAFEIARSDSDTTRRFFGDPPVADGKSPLVFRGLRPDDAFYLCGIRNGDALMAINGTQLDSSELALANYRAAITSPTWYVVTFRDGQSSDVIILAQEEAALANPALQTDERGRSP